MKRSIVSDVLPNHEFHFHGHGALKNIYKLIKVLRDCQDHEYHHHVTNYKNDFAVWITDMYGDERLAQRIRESHTKTEMIQHLEQAIAIEQEKEQRIYTPAPTSKVQERLSNIAKHVEHLEEHLKDMVDYTSHNQKVEVPSHHELMHHSWKRGVLEFTMGMLIGIIIGLLIARAAGFAI